MIKLHYLKLGVLLRAVKIYHRMHTSAACTMQHCTSSCRRGATSVSLKLIDQPPAYGYVKFITEAAVKPIETWLAFPSCLQVSILVSLPGTRAAHVNRSRCQPV